MTFFMIYFPVRNDNGFDLTSIQHRFHCHFSLSCVSHARTHSHVLGESAKIPPNRLNVIKSLVFSLFSLFFYFYLFFEHYTLKHLR